mmetsp:Transcript_43497/g.31316  ORF Transcript_43497/g.31316 Transcript_43497/m.31316 type:complete len:101 (+) Transcript_43497:135-437(+)
MGVKDIKEFHTENLAMNKDHYTLMARFTKAKVVNYFSTKGARVHFNTMKIEDPEMTEMTSKPQFINVRYGVVEFDDLKRDLQFWETCLASSMMQRPGEIL